MNYDSDQTRTSVQFVEELTKSIKSELPKISIANVMIDEAKKFGENLFCFDMIMSEDHARALKHQVLHHLKMVCEQLNLQIESVSNASTLLTKEHGEIDNNRRNKLLVTFKPA